MATKTLPLTLQLSPMQFNAGPKRIHQGADLLFKRARERKAAVVGGTESHAATRLFQAIPLKGRKHGYSARVHPYGLWLAVDKSFGKVMARGFEPVLEAKRVAPRLGGHQPRGIYWVEIESPEFGRIFVGMGHWLTKRPDTAERRSQNRAYTEAFDELLERGGKGHALAFLMGDTNDDDEHDDTDDTTQGQLEETFVTCWDDRRTWPSTNEGGTTIDVIARRRADKRVHRCSWAVSWSNPFKDHHDTLATFPVVPLRRKA